MLLSWKGVAILSKLCMVISLKKLDTEEWKNIKDLLKEFYYQHYLAR